jgi:hypothetical protein
MRSFYNRLDSPALDQRLTIPAQPAKWLAPKLTLRSNGERRSLPNRSLRGGSDCVKTGLPGRRLASLMPGSWNHLYLWIRAVDGLRMAA